MKKAFSLIALSSLFLIMVLFSFSQQAPSYDELRYRPLKGIKELMVGIENLTDAATGRPKNCTFWSCLFI